MFIRHGIFGGSAAAVVIPMSGYGGPDSGIFGRLLEWMIRERTDAVVVSDTTGESTTLGDREEMVVVRCTIGQVNGGIPVTAGTRSNCTEHAVELSEKTQELGVDALLQVMFCYNKASQGGLVRHFTQVADHVSIPIFLYSVPSHTGITIQPETYEILSEYPNIRGAKEANNSLSLIAKTAALCGEEFDIYSSNNDQTVPIMSLGGRGMVSVLASIMPKKIHQMYHLYLDENVKGSRRMQLKLLKIMKALFWDVSPIPVKVAPCMMEVCGDDLHPPLTPMEPEQREKLAEVMKRQGISPKKELYNRTDLL